MIQGVAYWAWLGSFYLVVLTVKDHIHKMNIDDRQNFFMMGATFALMSHVYRSVWYILTLIIITILLNYYWRKYNVLGGADISTLTWIFYGLGILNPFFLLAYLLYFGVFALLYMLLKKVIIKKLKLPQASATPFYIVILATFVSFAFLLKLYS